MSAPIPSPLSDADRLFGVGAEWLVDEHRVWFAPAVGRWGTDAWLCSCRGPQPCPHIQRCQQTRERA